VREDPAFGALPRRRHGEEPPHERVVVLRLVAEPLALSGDRDRPWLRALDEMREVDHAAVLVRHQRDRRPRARVREIVPNPRPDLLAEAQAVAGIRSRRGRMVLAAVRATAEAPKKLRIVRKAA